MFKSLLFSLVFLTLALSFSVAASNVPVITAPQNGQVLKGVVEVDGSIDAEGFLSAELYYAYANTESETWFLIAHIDKPVSYAVLANWDTSSISDGDYRLKLVVESSAGDLQETIVGPLLVRNYTSVEATVMPATAVVENNLLTTQPAPTESATAATPLPENQAAVSSGEVGEEVKTGLIVGMASIVALGIYILARGWLYRR